MWKIHDMADYATHQLDLQASMVLPIIGSLRHDLCCCTGHNPLEKWTRCARRVLQTWLKNYSELKNLPSPAAQWPKKHSSNYCNTSPVYASYTSTNISITWETCQCVSFATATVMASRVWRYPKFYTIPILFLIPNILDTDSSPKFWLQKSRLVWHDT